MLHEELLVGKTIAQPTRTIKACIGHYCKATESVDANEVDGELQVACMASPHDTFGLIPYETDSL
ncbi:hypothetical protein V8C42DRAFT_328178, partial [Trichoderma barbatum]